MSQTSSLPAALIRPVSTGTTANPNRSRRLCHPRCFPNTERERAQASRLGQTGRASRSLCRRCCTEPGGRTQINLGTQSILQLETCNLLPRQGSLLYLLVLNMQKLSEGGNNVEELIFVVLRTQKYLHSFNSTTWFTHWLVFEMPPQSEFNLLIKKCFVLF